MKLKTEVTLFGITAFVLITSAFFVSEAIAQGKFASSTLTTVVEKIGTTYPIAEEDAVVAIQKQLEEMQKSGKLAKLEQEAKDRVTNSALNLEPVKGLSVTQKPSVRFYEPSYTLPENVYDQEGNLIAAQGAVVKPLEVTSVRHKMFFFNGNDAKQVILAQKLAKDIGNNFMPILVEGRWDKMAEKLQQAVYFDQQGKMSRNFGLTEVPVMVSQDGKNLKIETFKP